MFDVALVFFSGGECGSPAGGDAEGRFERASRSVAACCGSLRSMFSW